MNTYTCKACGKKSYSAASDKGSEPCIYCNSTAGLIMTPGVVEDKEDKQNVILERAQSNKRTDA